MSLGLTFQGQTPVRKEPCEAALLFGRDASFIEVRMKSERSEATYTVEDLGAILTFIRQHDTALAMWNASGEPDTLEMFFRRRKLPAMCGCVADLLVRMGLASTQSGPPVRISATQV